MVFDLAHRAAADSIYGSKFSVGLARSSYLDNLLVSQLATIGRILIRPSLPLPVSLLVT